MQKRRNSASSACSSSDMSASCTVRAVQHQPYVACVYYHSFLANFARKETETRGKEHACRASAAHLQGPRVVCSASTDRYTIVATCTK